MLLIAKTNNIVNAIDLSFCLDQLLKVNFEHKINEGNSDKKTPLKNNSPQQNPFKLRRIHCHGYNTCAFFRTLFQAFS